MPKSPKTGTPHLKQLANGDFAFRMQVPAELWPYFSREIYKSLRGASKGAAVDYVEQQNTKWAATFARVRDMIVKRDAPALIRQRAEKMKIDLDSSIASLLDPSTTPEGEHAAIGKLSGLIQPIADATVRAMFDSLVGNNVAEVVAIDTATGKDIGHKHTAQPLVAALGDALFAMRERAALPAPATAAELARMPDHVALARMKSDAMDSLYGVSLDAEIRQSAPVLTAAGITLQADSNDPLALDKLVTQWLQDTSASRQETTTAQLRKIMDMFQRSQGTPSLLDGDLYEAATRFIKERIAAGKSRATVEKDVSCLESFGLWIKTRYRHTLAGNSDPFAGLLRDVRRHLFPKKTGAVSDQRHAFLPGAQTAAIVAACREAWGEDSDRFGCLVVTIATGCRVGDAINLRPSDIVKVRGEWCIDFVQDKDREARRDGSGRSAKTGEVETRFVPLHPDIQSVVLAAQKRNAGQPRLFSALSGKDTDSKVKQLGDAFTRLLRYAPSKGKIKSPSLIDRLVDEARSDGSRQDPKKLSVHSWRHTFVDVCTTAWGNKDSPEQLAIMGKTESRYGDAIKTLKGAPWQYRAKYVALPVLGAPK